jgi:HSP20 family protein
MTRTFDPFREVDRFFNEGFGTTGPAPMPMDLYRSGETFVARIDLPGVDPSTIDIDVEDRTLTVRAERPREDLGEVRWLSRERPTGTFARQLALGRGLALDKIEADYVGGVLTLTIPVAEEAKPRKIAVTTGGDKAQHVELEAQPS